MRLGSDDMINKKRQIKKLEKKEQKLLYRKPLSEPLQQKVRERIPDKAMQTLESAFQTSFSIVFKKGSKWIEKVIKLEDQQAIGAYLKKEFQQEESRTHFKAFDQRIRSTKLHHVLWTQTKSGVLGLLGIGIPDIPLYLASLLASVYTIGATYGFHIKEEQEKAYVLLLLCAVCDEEEHKQRWKTELNDFTERGSHFTLQELIPYVAHALAYRELQAKFLQGIPLIGVVGAVMSSTLQANIISFAHVSYKKRLLKEKGHIKI